MQNSYPWDWVPKIYTGIGSRETPDNIIKLMTQIAGKLSYNGWVLRSGGADGADSAFEDGAKFKEIYLPWPNFNGKEGYHLISSKAEEIASQYHPAWSFLKQGAQKLHARNVYQVLGKGLNEPSAFILCWTPDGATTCTSQKTGGTGQALRIANGFNVPVFNLALNEHYNLWDKFLILK